MRRLWPLAPLALMMLGTFGCNYIYENAMYLAITPDARDRPRVRVRITEPRKKPAFVTLESKTTVCGTVRDKKAREFTFHLIVVNQANGFETTVMGAKSKDTRVAEWCTWEKIPLKSGKNKIVARNRKKFRRFAYHERDAITITRKVDESEGGDP